MTTDQMMYFVEIVNQKSISKAAKRLHISQPSMSAALKRLEAELGVQLIRRSNNGAELTESGKRIYNECIHVLAIVKSWYAEDNNWGTDELRIAISPANGEIVAELLLNDISKKQPRLNVIFSEATPPGIEMMIMHREADIYITSILPEENVRFRNMIEKMGLELCELMKDELILAISAEHPFAQKGYLSLEDCSCLTLIQRVERDSVAEKYRGYFSSDKRILHSNREQVLHMVSSGRGVTFIPRALLSRNKYYLEHKIFPVPIQGTMIPITHVLVCPSYRARTRAQKQIVEQIKGVYREGL